MNPPPLAGEGREGASPVKPRTNAELDQREDATDDRSGETDVA